MKSIPTAKVIPVNWGVSPKVTAFTTTRVGGFSMPPFDGFNLAQHVGDDAQTVTANRRELAGLLNFEPSFQWLIQVHGTRVCKIDVAAKPYEADALVTQHKGIACCVLTADCLPVFIAAKDGSEVGIVHAGWRGLVAGVIENTIQNMKTPVQDIAAYLGPAIGPCHFEVGIDVVKLFTEADGSGAVESCFRASVEPDKYMADLFGLARHRLLALGVEVSSSNTCTVCESGTLYSYRHSPVTGRMANVILINA
ncbi:MAG: YfiH family protein [Pseudohongiellaceae bacterium]|jgi:YfiH family protein